MVERWPYGCHLHPCALVCRRASLSEKVGLALVHSVRSAKVNPDGIPFELRMLEVLLEQTVRYLEDKSNKIKMLSNAVQEVCPQSLTPPPTPVLVPVCPAVLPTRVPSTRGPARLARLIAVQPDAAPSSQWSILEF